MNTDILIGVLESGTRRGRRVPPNARVPIQGFVAGDLTVRVQVVDSTGAPISLYGYTCVLTVKQDPDIEPPLIARLGNLNKPDGVGRVDFPLVPADTVGLDAGRYVYDVWITDDEGVRNAVLPAAPFVLDAAVSYPDEPLTSVTPTPVTFIAVPPLSGVDFSVLTEHPPGTLTWLVPEEDTTDNFIFYISPTGNDSNGGKSPSDPLATIDAALAKIPPTWGKQARIIAAVGAYVISGTKVYRIGSGAGPLAEPLAIIAPFVDQLGPRTSSAATSTVLTDSTLSMTVNAQRGMRLRMISGAANGQARLVVSNTSTALTLETALLPSPTAGDAFVVEAPGAVFTYNDNVTFVGAGCSPLALQGLAFTPGADNLTLQFEGLNVVAEGFKLDLASRPCAMVVTNGARFYAESDAPFLPGVFDARRSPVGMYIANGNGDFDVTAIGPGTVLGGYIVGNAANVVAYNGGSLDIDAVYATASAGNGVTVLNGSQAIIRAAAGSGNTGFGLSVIARSTAFVGFGCTMAGSAGQVQLGSVTKLWSDIDLLPPDGTGGFTDLDSLSHIEVLP